LFITSFILLASFIKSLDVKALDKITEIFPPEVKLYGDSVYTDYQIEDYLIENKCVELKTQRKKNSKRPDSEKQSRQKLKITMYIFGLQLFKIINN